jgi:hypothetical protein
MLLGIHSLAAFMQLELFWVFTRHFAGRISVHSGNFFGN